MLDKAEVTIGFKSARRRMARGVGQAGSLMSEGTCYEKLRSLEAKGCVVLLGTEHGGTKIRLNLPAEIIGVVPLELEHSALDLDEMDFFAIPENRLLIFQRESGKCFYCLRKIDATNFVVEHVVSRPEGNNNYKNVVAACRQCNNRKGRTLAEDYLRTLYRDSFLTAEELEGRLSRLQRLQAGELKPNIELISTKP
jgi:hypothetical protein